MNIEEYFLRFPEAERYRGFIWAPLNPRMIRHKGRFINIDTRIYNGVLLFDEETAPCLAGPFPGGAAGLWIRDHRIDFRFPLPSDEELREYFERNPFRYAGESDEMAIERNVRQSRSKDRPFSVYIFGNDDTSYTKMYATEEQAREEVLLLEAIEPVNLWKDVEPLGFFFSN